MSFVNGGISAPKLAQANHRRRQSRQRRQRRQHASPVVESPIATKPQIRGTWGRIYYFKLLSSVTSSSLFTYFPVQHHQSAKADGWARSAKGKEPLT